MILRIDISHLGYVVLFPSNQKSSQSVFRITTKDPSTLDYFSEKLVRQRHQALIHQITHFHHIQLLVCFEEQSYLLLLLSDFSEIFLYEFGVTPFPLHRIVQVSEDDRFLLQY